MKDNNLPGGASFQDPIKYCHVTCIYSGLFKKKRAPTSYFKIIPNKPPLEGARVNANFLT